MHTHAPVPPATVDMVRYALKGALESLEAWGPRAVATPRAGGGWILEVIHPSGRIEATAEMALLPDGMDDNFPGNSAGHRLIEVGWCQHPAAHHDRSRRAGWARLPDQAGAWTAPVVPAE